MKYRRYKPKAKYTKGAEIYRDTKATDDTKATNDTKATDDSKATEAYPESRAVINRETPYLFALLFLFFFLF